MKENLVHSKAWRGIAGDKWLLKLEKKAFGWHFWSTHNEHEYGYEISSDGTSGHTTHKIIQWMEFRRPEPFTRNFLFKLTEFFSKIFSFIRRIFIPIGLPLLIISLVGGLLCTYAFDFAGFGELFLNIAKWMAIGFAISIAGTLLFAGLGFLWRKVFRIDEKLKELRGDDLEAACYFQDEVQ